LRKPEGCQRPGIVGETHNGEAAEVHFSVHNDGQGTTLLAKQGDEITGYVTVGISWLKKIPLIAEFVVMEPYSRHGLGYRLLDLAETYIKENLGDKVVLWVPIVSACGPAQR